MSLLQNGFSMSELDQCDQCDALLIPEQRCRCSASSLTRTSMTRLQIMAALAKRLRPGQRASHVHRHRAIGRGPRSLLAT